MYSQIDSNRRKSTVLISLFIGILALAGYAYGEATGTGSGGLVIALLISVGMTLFSWFFGDSLVLWSSGARQITKKEDFPYLWNMVENLCITTGLPMPAVYVIDDPSPNAFATGRDPKHASVAVTRGLIELLENEELEGVLAHELSHIKNYDIRWMLLVAVLVGALTLIGDMFLRGGFLGRRSSDRDSGNGILVLLGIAFLVLSPIIGQLIKFAISRQREYLADASGALMTRYPQGLASALAKIRDHGVPLQTASRATAHLWIANPFGAHAIGSRAAELFSTHPPIEKRIAALDKMSRAES